MILRFNDYIKESINDIFNKKYTYQELVQSALVDILMNINNISEKDFSRVDMTIKNVKDLISNNIKAQEIIGDFELNDKRVDYCAETIYDEIIKK